MTSSAKDDEPSDGRCPPAVALSESPVPRTPSKLAVTAAPSRTPNPPLTTPNPPLTGPSPLTMTPGGTLKGCGYPGSFGVDGFDFSGLSFSERSRQAFEGVTAMATAAGADTLSK